LISFLKSNQLNFIKMKKDFSNLMKLLSLTMMLAFIMPVIAKAQGGKANFAGSWALNESKSTMPQGGGGGGGMRGGREFTIVQDANLLTRKSVSQDGTERVAKYTLDGKESVNTMGENQSKSVATWSADGKSLTIKTSMEFNGNAFTTTAVWSMPDAKTLSITTTRPGRDGGAEVKTTMVYDKK
jgi:hypothetical protein